MITSLPARLSAPEAPHPIVHLSASGSSRDREIRVMIREALNRLVREVAVWGFLQPGAVADLLLAAAELADNACRHADSCSVRVRCLEEDRLLRLEVADRSPHMPVVTAGVGGLALVTALAVRWGCEKDPAATGKVVFADIHPEQWLGGDERLKALVRRHPERFGSAPTALAATRHRTTAPT